MHHCHRFKSALALLKRRLNSIRCNFVLGLAIASLLFVVMLLPFSGPAQSTDLPPLGTHPLPSTLAQWQDPTHSGDYFANVQPTAVGYLIWSQFPIKVYVESGLDASVGAPTWVTAVLQAVREWSVYLPLEVVQEVETADIVVMRWRPPLRASFNRNTGQLQLERIRAAEARYELYKKISAKNPAILAHKFTINLKPNQALESIQASARHEIGHALGIWGHSNLETDALYFSQVRNPTLISSRDINTLKRIYEQPTRLGWPLSD